MVQGIINFFLDFCCKQLNIDKNGSHIKTTVISGFHFLLQTVVKLETVAAETVRTLPVALCSSFLNRTGWFFFLGLFCNHLENHRQTRPTVGFLQFYSPLTAVPWAAQCDEELLQEKMFRGSQTQLKAFFSFFNKNNLEQTSARAGSEWKISGLLDLWKTTTVVFGVNISQMCNNAGKLADEVHAGGWHSPWELTTPNS